MEVELTDIPDDLAGVSPDEMIGNDLSATEAVGEGGAAGAERTEDAPQQQGNGKIQLLPVDLIGRILYYLEPMSFEQVTEEGKKSPRLAMHALLSSMIDPRLALALTSRRMYGEVLRSVRSDCPLRLVLSTPGRLPWMRTHTLRRPMAEVRTVAVPTTAFRWPLDTPALLHSTPDWAIEPDRPSICLIVPPTDRGMDLLAEQLAGPARPLLRQVVFKGSVRLGEGRKGSKSCGGCGVFCGHAWSRYTRFLGILLWKDGPCTSLKQCGRSPICCVCCVVANMACPLVVTTCLDVLAHNVTSAFAGRRPGQRAIAGLDGLPTSIDEASELEAIGGYYRQVAEDSSKAFSSIIVFDIAAAAPPAAAPAQRASQESSSAITSPPVQEGAMSRPVPRTPAKPGLSLTRLYLGSEEMAMAPLAMVREAIAVERNQLGSIFAQLSQLKALEELRVVATFPLRRPASDGAPPALAIDLDIPVLNRFTCIIVARIVPGEGFGGTEELENAFDVSSIANLPKLEELTLGVTGATDAGYGPVFSMPRLRKLGLWLRKDSINATRTFLALPELRHLRVNLDGVHWMDPGEAPSAGLVRWLMHIYGADPPRSLPPVTWDYAAVDGHSSAMMRERIENLEVINTCDVVDIGQGMLAGLSNLAPLATLACINASVRVLSQLPALGPGLRSLELKWGSLSADTSVLHHIAACTCLESLSVTAGSPKTIRHIIVEVLPRMTVKRLELLRLQAIVVMVRSSPVALRGSELAPLLEWPCLSRVQLPEVVDVGGLAPVLNELSEKLDVLDTKLVSAVTASPSIWNQ
ncbi:unnamed protein product [Pedinophyceae sp. YPF-701]|nr:unnamed protein product [Pedinophyceae sp. YPF-701]